MTRPVLLTRAESDSLAIAARLEAVGRASFIEPLLTIVPTGAPLPGFAEFDVVALTSANAIAFLPVLRHPAYTVGDHTAAKAREAGFQAVRSAGGNAGDLMALLQRELPDGTRILHPSGTDIAAPVDFPRGSVTHVAVYRAEAALSLSDACLRQLNGDGFSDILFFSPRTGAIFADLIRAAGLEARLSGTNALCLSGAVVESVKRLPWGGIRQARQPDREDMIALLQ